MIKEKRERGETGLRKRWVKREQVVRNSVTDRKLRWMWGARSCRSRISFWKEIGGISTILG